MFIENIINQHAEEASHLWLLRDYAVTEPHFDLSDLANLDMRLEAHLDGLRIAADPGWETCRHAMAYEEPGEIFSAAVLAFESGDPERMDIMLTAVETDPGLQRALVSALGWIEFNTIAGPARKLLDADLPFLRYLGLAAHAVHRKDPGEILLTRLRDSDTTVRARAIKTVGELGRVDLLPWIMPDYTDAEEWIRFCSARSGLLLGDAQAAVALQGLVEQFGPYADQAVVLAAHSLAPAYARGWLAELSDSAQGILLAVRGYGALGDPEAIDWLISLIYQPRLARAAGEAFSMITGADLADEDLDTDPPEGFQTGASEDPEDEDVALDPDEDLPWPDPELVAAWWQTRKNAFQNGTRYLAGRPVRDADHLRAVLRNGYQRQRIAAALNLALTRPGEPLFEYRAPGYRQQHLLGITSQNRTT